MKGASSRSRRKFQMDYPLAISPDLKIDAKEFAAVWNQDSASRDIAQAKSAEASTEKFIGLDPELMRQGLVFLVGVASTIALDVIKDLIKDRIMKILTDRSGSKAAPMFEVIVVQPGDKSIIIVRAKAEQA
jgi:hypothetical protein